LVSVHPGSAASRALSNPESRYCNVSEAAALLGVSRVTMSRWIRDGRVPVARLGHRTIRIRREDLDQLLHAAGSPVQSRIDHASSERASDELERERAIWSGLDEAEHFLHLYEEDAVLVDAVGEYIGAVLRAEGAGIVIATAAHRNGIESLLRSNGLNPDAERAAGRYVDLDATETLESFLVNGQPDVDRFNEVIGSVVETAAADGRPVRAFGEMVAILAADGNHAAAMELERLWNQLQERHRFALFCAYPMDVFRDAGLSEAFEAIADEHGHVIPAESFTARANLEDRRREVARLQQQSAALRAEVAESRRLQAQLRRSERELRDFVENATEGLHWVGPDGRIIWANHAELELLGYTADEYIGRSITEFHADQDVITDILNRLRAGEELRDYEATLRAKDGSLKHVLINSSVYREDGRFVHSRCFTRDITAWRQAEEASRRLAAIVASSDDAIIGKTLDGTVTDWNQGAERLYGYTAEEMVGQPISMLIPLDRPDEFPSIMNRLRRGERIDHFETERICKDGRRLTVSVTISPVRDLSGRIVGASAIARDVSERKMIEREREALLAREREAHAEAAAALRLRDEFLSVAAHELRTPLASLKAHAQVAMRRLERSGQLEPERVAEALKAMASQSDKLNRLLGHLLDISRINAGKLILDVQQVDLVAMVEEVVKNARTRNSTHQITLTAPPALDVEADSLRLEQVLTNLLDNAMKYSAEGSPIEIDVSQAGEGTLEIAVRDHGVGIPSEKRARIFERFYQAHGSGFQSGLGLGLYVSGEIVELHGGEIRAEFPPDGGSRFVVRLPIQSGAERPDCSGDAAA
jgi:PAS domain S-box-containing protein/excisionase family DNA binding protein